VPGGVQRSTDRILTTHTGSLPRPEPLVEMLVRVDRGDLADDDPAFRATVRAAVAGVVARQLAAGLTVVNDGEAGKVGYATYVKERLDGFAGEDVFAHVPPDQEEFPEYIGRVMAGVSFRMPACTAPVVHRSLDRVRGEIADLRGALAGADTETEDAFMTAASPGVIAFFLANRHYPDDDAYLAALADAMKPEYDEIHRSGLVLQIDCPDLAMGRHMIGDDSLEAFRARIERHVDALNHATRDIPPESMRLHLCWGNYEAPHVHDVPLGDIIDIVLRARPAGISFEGANPRHEHEWRVFADVALPDGKVLIPGVLDSTTNYVEHPELVAQRIVRYAQLVGRENVIAGTDCGFATFANLLHVDPAITWAKLRAMADGAALASRELW
jgi:5-methyltetrahydropteroyltriglutamate--homocysteine methyltransferase